MSLQLNCQSISKAHGPRQLFQDLSLSIFRGDRIGVIGPNGSGKSTLLKMLAEKDLPDEGNISKQKGLCIEYVPQESHPPAKSIEQVVREVIETTNTDPHEAETRTRIILGKLGFDDFNQTANTLSGGWIKRLDIAKALVHDPDLLLLDEPTNHLDLEGILWLETFLKKAPFSFIVVSHDRAFLENVSTRTIELNPCYPNSIFAVEGPYSAFLEKRQEFLSGQLQHQKSLSSKVRREVDWLKRTPQARSTKSQSRIQEAERLIGELSEVKSRNQPQKTGRLDFSSTKRQTKRLVVAHNIGKSVEGRVLFSSLNFTLSPGSRLGIVGGNGSGKSTLLRILAGTLEPDTGSIKKAESIRIVYFDQQRAELPENLTLRRALAPRSDRIEYGNKIIHVNGWCKRFAFSPDRLELPVRQLSGGEKARVLIARLLIEPADVLLLDEPTNDLDIDTLELLEDGLQQFPGAVVLITHDRLMLDQVCNQLVGMGAGVGLEGSNFFADYRQWEASQEKAKKPKPIKKTAPKRVLTPSSKLSYKEKLEWEQMEAKILATEHKIADLEAAVAGTTADPQQMQKLCRELDTKQEALERMYARWEELDQRAS